MCDTCNQNKTYPSKPYGPLQPHDVPDRPWEQISIDYITHLTKGDSLDSKGHTAILTVTDLGVSKQVHFIPAYDEDDWEKTVHYLIRDIFRIHGLPRSILSDRGPQFASKVTQGIYKRLGIKASLSTAYHPQTDGQTERWNKEVEQYLRIYCDFRQQDWPLWLPLAEFAMNKRTHASTRKSPFKVIYGRTLEFHVTAQ